MNNTNKITIPLDQIEGIVTIKDDEFVVMLVSGRSVKTDFNPFAANQSAAYFIKKASGNVILPATPQPPKPPQRNEKGDVICPVHGVVHPPRADEEAK